MKWLAKWRALHGHLLSINRRNIEYVYPCNPRRFFPLADDKVRTKEWLEQIGVRVAPTYLVVDSFGAIRSAIQKLHRLEKAVIKPAKGRGGGGIMPVVNRNGMLASGSGAPLTDEHIRQHLADIIFGNYSFGANDRAIVEAFIVPHSLFHHIYPSGVPDVRIIAYHGHPVLAMVRIPTHRSGGKANLHQGALGVGVDMRSGAMLQGLWKGEYLSHHPDTGKPIEGVAIPFWSEVISVVRKIGSRAPLKYLGVDVVVTPEGPLVMEINVRPGLEIQNINRKGLRALLEAVRTS